MDATRKGITVSARTSLWCVIAVTLLAGCAAGPKPNGAPPPLASVPQAVQLAEGTFKATQAQVRYVADWKSAIQQVALQRDEAYARLTDLIASAEFEGLTMPQQHAGLLLGGVLAMAKEHYTYAQQLLMRSSAMPEAVFADWQARLDAAISLRDRSDALVSLTTLLQRWPGETAKLSPPAIRDVVLREPQTDEQRELAFQVLNRLFDLSYKMEDGVEAGPFWTALIEELVERGQLARAARVVPRITDPYDVLWMRVDRRFDALVRKDPRRFDELAVAGQLVEEYAQAAQRHPRSLDAVVQLTYAYLYAGRYQDVLSATNSVIARATAAGGISALYDDVPSSLNWIYDNRAQALEATHRWDEAEAERVRSANRVEHGHRNVSNVINLAGFYANRGRGEDAVATLRFLPSEIGSISRYGQMQVRLERLRAAVALHDDAEVQNCLAYLRENKSDAIGSFESALLRANAADEAEQLIIERLKDPRLRRDALLEVQEYSFPAEPASIEKDRALWTEILERPAVKAAIDAVGRRERTPLPP